MQSFVQRWARLVGVLSLVAGAGAAQAALVSSVPVGLDAKVITFSAYDTAPPASVSGGLDVGTAEVGEVVTLTGEAASVVTSAARNFGTNGNWPVDGAYASLNDASGSLTFTFSRGLNFVGGLVNYLPSTDASTIISALDIDGNVILDVVFETASLDFTDGARFLGFSRSSADIYGLSLSSNFVSLDNLTFGTLSAAPEPQSLLLVLAALGALGWRQRRRRSTPR